MLFPQEIIYRKREGNTLTTEEISFMIQGMLRGDVTDSQISALTMAIFFRGMNARECGDLTRIMTQSGRVMTWPAQQFNGPILDKHSTGGVGDKVSLMLAPMVAACGGFVPMISGRSLGHTGGTLDKLQSIPGYNVKPDPQLLEKVLKQVGCAIIGQTDDLAPADRRLYSIRDACGTVESIPLITASILSKKLAAGLQGLVMDVKWGNAAFMNKYDRAKELALNLIRTAKAAGLPTRALLTDMNQPLGATAGNSLEIAETIAYLSGAYRDQRLHEVVISLGAHMLLLGKLAHNEATARKMLQQKLDGGQAADIFQKMVVHLGGPADFMSQYQHYLPTAKMIRPVPSPEAGYIQAIDTRQIGLVIMLLGGGRKKPQDTIDLSVGCTHIQQVGTKINRGDPLMIIHGNNADLVEQAIKLVQKSYVVAAQPVKVSAVVNDCLLEDS
ncbi:MAG: thymidine phosphorylase [Alphaproteobacteria bacterium]|nr:thymidine phosphorylase [Alphaproteobacteria bacterium]